MELELTVRNTLKLSDERGSVVVPSLGISNCLCCHYMEGGELGRSKCSWYCHFFPPPCQAALLQHLLILSSGSW